MSRRSLKQSIPTKATASSARFQTMIPSSSYHLPSLKSISNARSLQRALMAFAARSACLCWTVR
eukprot:2736158-Prymnesium_polylepis.1